MKVAIVHDWLVNFGGAEQVVLSLLKIFPDADIFTLVYDKKKMQNCFPYSRIFTSGMQRIPFAKKLYTKLLSVMPRAFESFDLSAYDLVISSSSSCAKGVITSPQALHVAYIHTPMRYAWDLFFDYKKRSGFITRFFMNIFMPRIREWDFISAQRIDFLIANSHYIQKRIKKFWSRDSRVIYPPVHTEKIFPAKNPSKDFYLAFSRLVPYKRIDIALDACLQLGKKLMIVGSGSEEKKLKKRANGNALISFKGRISDEELLPLMQNCKALLFCAEEDFGIIPLEVQAAGRPVIAFKKGGALETVIENKTGIFFDEQNATSLADAICTFEKFDAKNAFKKTAMVQNAKRFSEARFLEEMRTLINTISKKQ